MPEEGSSFHWKAKKVNSSMPTQNCGAARVISVKVVPTRSSVGAAHRRHHNAAQHANGIGQQQRCQRQVNCVWQIGAQEIQHRLAGIAEGIAQIEFQQVDQVDEVLLAQRFIQPEPRQQRRFLLFGEGRVDIAGQRIAWRQAEKQKQQGDDDPEDHQALQETPQDVIGDAAAHAIPLFAACRGDQPGRPPPYWLAQRAIYNIAPTIFLHLRLL